MSRWCHCTKCLGLKKRVFKTIRTHTELDIRLRDQSDEYTTPQFLDYLNDCIEKNMQNLEQLDADGINDLLTIAYYLIEFADVGDDTTFENNGVSLPLLYKFLITRE